MVLTTPRLVLKPHTLANAERLNAWQNDPELLYLNDDEPPDRAARSLEQTRAFIGRHSGPTKSDEIIHWAIHLKSDDEFIGYCMAAFIDPYNRSCKFGLTIGEKEHWGQGYARETTTAILDFVFKEIALNRVQCELYDFNDRSLRLVRHLGFTHEGTHRQAVWKNGRFRDELVFAILRDEWSSRASGADD